MVITEQEIEDLTGQFFEQSRITALVTDMLVIAGDCFAKLDDAAKKTAMKYLVAHFLTLQGIDGQGMMQSESLGDASYSFWTAHRGAGSKATDFGQLAKRIAPCLGEVMGDKQYGGVRLIR